MIRPAWLDPELVAKGREPMHALRHPPLLELDGTWRFQLLDRADAEPGEHWREIAVPGCWTMQGTADIPRYTNVRMPFEGVPPQVPEANPTGVYEREFELRAPAQGARTVLHVGAAESVLILELNGVEVGVSKDSHLAAEFDVSGIVQPGGNRLRLRVVKWSDASYVEDQDQWWHGGITRSVYLYQTGPVYLADATVIAGLSDDLVDGSLDIRVRIGWTAPHVPQGWTVEAAVAGLGGPWAASFSVEAAPGWPRDAAGLAVMRRRIVEGPNLDEVTAATWAELQPVLEPPAAGTAEMRASLPRVEPWSAELPRLYDLRLVLRSPSGDVVETTVIPVGFRRVEVRGTDLLVNGRRVIIRGVNRHDVDGLTGRVVSRQAMVDDVVAMKRAGFNAVRTSHYPNDPAFLELTDELGLYVVAEADIEAHAYQSSLCHDSRYLDQWLARVSRMVQRDRNHASVIIWSLGNESGYGANHDAVAGWLRRTDPSRPLQYEGAIHFDWHGGQAASDIVCPMYPELEDIVAYAASGHADRPLIMCEFSHAMGNSNGTLAEHWDAIEATPGLQGGFIWEWRDHGLRQVLPGGGTRWATGGDFGDVPNDGGFCADGLHFPDRAPKPALREHQHLAAPVRVEADAVMVEGGRIRVRNRQQFRDLGWLRGRWSVADEGVVMSEGEVDLPAVPAGDAAMAMLGDWRALAPADGERWLTLVFRTAREEPWAAAGAEVGWHQVRLDGGARRPDPGAVDPSGSVAIDEDGVLQHPALAVGPRLSLWRAPTDNDRIAGLAARWRELGVDRPSVRLVDIEREGASTTVRTEVVVGATVLRHVQAFAPLVGGAITVTEAVELPDVLRDVARVGTLFELRQGFDEVEWYGLGPHECYPDRQRSGLVGRWTSSLAGLHVPYLRPQESGGRAGVRWMRFRATDGRFVAIRPALPAQLTASRFRDADLDAAGHQEDLVPVAGAVVHLDAVHRGLGTASCGPDTLPDYVIGPGMVQWTWTLEADTPSGSSRIPDPSGFVG